MHLSWYTFAHVQDEDPKGSKRAPERPKRSGRLLVHGQKYAEMLFRHTLSVSCTSHSRGKMKDNSRNASESCIAPHLQDQKEANYLTCVDHFHFFFFSTQAFLDLQSRSCQTNSLVYQTPPIESFSILTYFSKSFKSWDKARRDML